MKKVKKVLQNGFKYPQNSTRTVICDRIGRFDKIGRFENIRVRVRVRVSEKELQDGDKYPQNSSTSFFSLLFISLSVKSVKFSVLVDVGSDSTSLNIVRQSRNRNRNRNVISIKRHIINFIITLSFLNALNALKFPKIIKNYYGAPPPP